MVKLGLGLRTRCFEITPCPPHSHLGPLHQVIAISWFLVQEKKKSVTSLNHPHSASYKFIFELSSPSFSLKAQLSICALDPNLLSINLSLRSFQTPPLGWLLLLTVSLPPFISLSQKWGALSLHLSPYHPPNLYPMPFYLPTPKTSFSFSVLLVSHIL